MHPIEKYIRSVPDFPKEGIIFRDITTIVQSPEGFQIAIDGLEELVKDIDFNKIVVLESRGFLFGAPMARDLKKSVVLVRKKGKLPFEKIAQDYELEYGTATFEVHTDSIEKGDKVVIVDDLLATGGSIKAAAKLVEKLGGQVMDCISIIELKGLNGREELEGYRVDSVIAFDGK